MVMLKTRRVRRFGGAHRQRGVALITVLLVFALVAVIATEMLHRSQLSLRSVGNLIETRQAYYYALGGEAFARQLLARDIIDGHGDIDALTEAWAQTKDQQPFEIDNGTLQIEINDLQGRFNLNNATDAAGIEQFQKLLKSLQLNPDYALEWRRWISVTSSADNDTEESNPTPAPRQPEADVSALRLLDSMQPQDYAKLAPHVTVLRPGDAASGGKTAININTADDVVLQSVATSTMSAQILARQKTGGIKDVAEVGLDASVATPNSNFFEVIVTVNYANRWQRIRTVLARSKNGSKVELKVISRVRSPLIDDIES